MYGFVVAGTGFLSKGKNYVKMLPRRSVVNLFVDWSVKPLWNPVPFPLSTFLIWHSLGVWEKGMLS